MIRLVTVLALVLPIAAHAIDVDFQQVSPADGVGQVEFNHLVMNASGQYVAATRSRIYVGSVAGRDLKQAFSSDSVGFVVNDSTSQTVNGASYRLDFQLLGTRLAINDRGDYIIASNTRLYAGTVSGGEPRAVFEDSNSRFLAVALNSVGDFVATSNKSVVAGNVAEAQAVRVISDAPGSFVPYTLNGISGNWDVEAGECHLAINDSGQFVAASFRALYAGSVTGRAAKKVYEDNRVGFRQVTLNAQGQFVAVSSKNVFVGQIRGSSVQSFQSIHRD